MDEATKPCTKCGEIKPLTDYYKRAKSPDGRQPRCKACDEAKRRDYRMAIRLGVRSKKRLPNSRRLCEVEGCERVHYGHGWCSMHYGRWATHGDPLTVSRIAFDNSGPCAIEGCGDGAVSRGWCNPHYQRWYHYGDPNVVTRELVPNNGRCGVEGCVRRPRSPTSVWCETHYQRWYRNGRDPEAIHVGRERHDACVKCGEPTVGRRFCDSRCAARFRRGTPQATACVICGQSFPTTKTRSTCSDACRRELSRQHDRRYHQNAMANNPRYRDNLRRAGLRRRALMVAAFVENFSPLEIHERDNWTCGICGAPIDPALPWPDRWSATIDHVVPLALGGKHERANAQSAHLTCNCSKRDRLLASAQ